MKTIRVLVENGIDIRNIPQSVYVNGKKQRFKISEIIHEGIEQIIEENDLNGNKTITDALKSLKRAYSGTGKEQALTEKEKEQAEKLLGEDFFERRFKGDDIGKATLGVSVTQCDAAQRILERAVEQEKDTNKRKCENYGE